jgi:hypothetical protein
VPNASQQFVKAFSAKYLKGNTQGWEALGYKIKEEEEE